MKRKISPNELKSSDVKLEENSPKAEESKNVDESSKDSEKDSVKKKSGKLYKEMRLLARPVEVTGCRARKQVERLKLSSTQERAPKEKRKFPKGKGRKLGDCPRIDNQIQKSTIAVLQLLHRILFARVGPTGKVKKNIRRFSGFPFEKTSPEFDRRIANIEKKFSITDLIQMCEVLELRCGGTREDIVMRILDFLLKPKAPRKKYTKSKKTPVETAKKPEKNEMKKEEKKTPTKGAKRKTNEDGDESASSDVKPIAKKNKMPKVKELSEYEKIVQKNRDEKLAFLQSLRMNEVKEDLNEAIMNLKPPKRRGRGKGVVVWPKHPVRKSVRLKNVHFDFSEETLLRQVFDGIEEEIKEA